MFKAVLTRLDEDDKQTLGSFILYDGIHKVFEAQTLELPWLDNEQFISCIPTGQYICKRRQSTKYGHHFIISDVKGREFILIHWGNFYGDTKGCIALGRDFIDIDNDGHKDVTSSKPTMKQLNNVLDGILFSLTIIDLVRAY